MRGAAGKWWSRSSCSRRSSRCTTRRTGWPPARTCSSATRSRSPRPPWQRRARCPGSGPSCAPLSLFSDTDFPVLPALPGLAPAVRAWPWLRRRSCVSSAAKRRSGRRRSARLRARHGLPPAGNPLIEGQYSPHLNLALFSRVMAEPQPDWPPRTRVDRIRVLQRSGGVAASARDISRRGPAARRVHAGVFGGRRRGPLLSRERGGGGPARGARRAADRRVCRQPAGARA